MGLREDLLRGIYSYGYVSRSDGLVKKRYIMIIFSNFTLLTFRRPLLIALKNHRQSSKELSSHVVKVRLKYLIMNLIVVHLPFIINSCELTFFFNVIAQ